MSTVIWRFIDARPGHDAQSEGLVRALRDQIPVSVFDLAVNQTGRALWAWLSGRYPPGAQLPAPDLLLGAGHATHWHLLAARRCRGGRIIVLMKPSLPLACFDLCVIPQHDGPPQAANVLATTGVLNNIQPGFDHDAELGLILLGGPSRHFRWENDQLMAQIEQLREARPVKRWLLATSPRTPGSLVSALLERSGSDCVPFASTGPDWLPARLAEAGEVWVSEDSVSMIYEALTAGARVGLLKVRRKGSNRITSGVDSLVARRWVGAPGDWRLAEGPDEPLNEAARCAAWIKQQWLKNH